MVLPRRTWEQDFLNKFQIIGIGKGSMDYYLFHLRSLSQLGYVASLSYNWE